MTYQYVKHGAVTRQTDRQEMCINWRNCLRCKPAIRHSALT